MSKGRSAVKQAIREAFSRLGMHARPAEVAAVLAVAGIAVREEQVRAVALEMLRAAARIGHQQAQARAPAVQPTFRGHPRIPPRRGRR